METPERIKMLQLLKTQVEASRQIYNHVMTLENYFLGTDTGKGCSCKLKPVFTRLRTFWNDAGKQELENYEN